MKCPVCKYHDQYVEMSFHSCDFDENIITCRVCGTVWSANHGMAEIVSDPREESSLSATAECVEGADYSFAA
jgi:hypothetical protein